MRAFIFPVLIVAFVLCSSLAVAGSTEIVNGLVGVDIEEIYLSRASTEDWEEDILGDVVLEPGESVVVQFSPAENECEWDILAVDGEGTEATWEGLNLCGVGRITLMPGAEAVLE